MMKKYAPFLFVSLFLAALSRDTILQYNEISKPLKNVDFMEKLLQDQEIRNFHEALSEQERISFEELVDDTLTIHAKWINSVMMLKSRYKDVDIESLIDQGMTSMEDDFSTFSSRYSVLLQRISHSPHMAKKLIGYVENYLRDLLRTVDIH